MEYSKIIVFKALSDSTREDILVILKQEEKSVSEICQLFKDISQPTISHHLQILKRCSLVQSRKKGKLVLYSLNRRMLKRIMEDFLDRFGY